jgi:hypothetical protein
MVMPMERAISARSVMYYGRFIGHRYGPLVDGSERVDNFLGTGAAAFQIYENAGKRILLMQSF